MRNKFVFFLSCLALFTVPPLRAGVVSDAEISYSLNLPDPWVRVALSDSQHIFKDPTKTRQGILSITRRTIDTGYDSPAEWVQANLLAYLLTVEASIFPTGATIYFDSGAARQKQGSWAPEAWAIFFPADSTPAYMEFMVYSSYAGAGYEIFAIGDSADMAVNLQEYVGLIDSIRFLEPVVASLPVTAPVLRPDALRSMADVLGRRTTAIRSARGIYWDGIRLKMIETR